MNLTLPSGYTSASMLVRKYDPNKLGPPIVGSLHLADLYIAVALQTDDTRTHEYVHDLCTENV